MKIIEDIKKVFDVCSEHTNENLKDEYMYMYSNDFLNSHHFKNIMTRQEIKLRVTIKWQVEVEHVICYARKKLNKPRGR